MLRARANVEHADDKGRTPLMVALGLDPRLAEALLEAGASNNAADKIGWTVRLRAAKFASVDTLRAVMHPKPKSSRQWQVVVDSVYPNSKLKRGVVQVPTALFLFWLLKFGNTRMFSRCVVLLSPVLCENAYHKTTFHAVG